ncbi:hypothetical protein V2J09_017639 [Rumex salicifolius]
MRERSALRPGPPGYIAFQSRSAQFGSEMGYGSLPKLESGNLTWVSSNNCIKLAVETLNSEKTGDRGSSLSEQNPGGELGVKASNNTRMRKAIPKSKANVKEEKVGREDDESSCAKRNKPDEDDANKGKANSSEEKSENGKDNTKEGEQNYKKEAAKFQEPLKDYIHVRARRGQATDSHSLAERVRREKINERMKFLQDLVPGCNKLLKSVPLNEIGYCDPIMDVNMEALLSKEIYLERVESFIQAIGSYEDTIFQKRTRLHQKTEAAHHLDSSKRPQKVARLSSSASVGAAIVDAEHCLEMEMSDNKEELKEKLKDLIRLGEPGWKERYYEEKFSAKSLEELEEIRKDVFPCTSSRIQEVDA